jgi:hypothetical protein
MPAVRPALLTLERPPLILDQDGQRVEDFREPEGYDLNAPRRKGRASLCRMFFALGFTLVSLGICRGIGDAVVL